MNLYIANANALIPQAGRAVDTFPSGLVRVSQTYIGRTANAAAHRATLAVGNNMPDGDSSPCIDGLKIFPEVQERRREDGMTEFIVSAYGRANSTGNTTKSVDMHTLQVPIYPAVTNQSNPSAEALLPVNPFITVILVADTLTRSFVVPASAPNSAIPMPTQDANFTVIGTTFEAFKAIVKRAYPNAQLTLGDFTGAIFVAYALKSINRTSYGSFDEASATFNGTPSVVGYVTVTGTL